MLKHALVWLVTTIFMYALLPAVIDPQTYLSKVKSEQATLASEIGQDSADNITATTGKFYNAIFENSGIHPWVTTRFQVGSHSDDKVFNKGPVEKAAMYADRYLVSFFVSMYETIFRLTQLFYWVLFALPFIAAAAFDGLMQRKVRSSTFQYSSPFKYSALWHFIIVLFSGTLICCNAPLTMPAVIFPILAFVFAMSMRSLFASMQQSA